MIHSATAAVGAILGQVPSGLFVVTSQHGREKTGMLASWVMQAGFDPPMVSVAVNSGRPLAKWLLAGESFVLNVLSENDKLLIGHFGRGIEPGEPAFDGLNVTSTDEGLPILADALGFLVCKPKGNVDSGDHRIFIAEVSDGRILNDARPYVHIRKNGLRY
ncbi:MAG: flavin reductase [Pirellulales bacterium]|nr:flavin reductase [Pirellulales bacterium]